MPSFTKGDVRIQYEEVGSGFPLLVTPGGGLNSVISGWPGQVFNAMEVFKDDFRCITMDQRNANGGESSGPVQIEDPWGAFADDQLGLMDHLGIEEFFFMGYCIGGPFALKLIERAPERVLAAVFCQPVGHASKTPDSMYDSGHDLWGPELCATAVRRDDGDRGPVPSQPLSHTAGLHVQRIAGVRELVPDADAGDARRHAVALLRGSHGPGRPGSQSRGNGISVEGGRGHQGQDG